MSDREKEEDPLVEIAALEAMRTGRVVRAVRDEKGERFRYGGHFNPEMQGPVPPDRFLSDLPTEAPQRPLGLLDVFVMGVSAVLLAISILLLFVMFGVVPAPWQ